MLFLYAQQNDKITRMLRKEIREYLLELDGKSEPFSFHDVAGKIREVIQKEDERSLEDNAEIFAFNVYTDTSNGTSWNSYFGPMMSFANADGTPNDFPSKSVITNEVLEYWESRFKESKHPLFKARYADLLIEFSKLTGRKVELEFAKVSIRSHLKSIRQEHEKDIHTKDALNRALTLALKFNDAEIVSEILNEAVLLEREIGEDDKPGLWGFVMDWFVLDPKIEVPADVKDATVEDMVNRHKRLLEGKKLWPLKSATTHLANYYTTTKDHSSLRSVLNSYEKAVRESDEFKKGTLGELHYLQDLEELYVPYAVSDEIKSDLAKIRTELHKFRLDPNSSEFKEISVETTVPTKQIEEFVDNLFQTEEISEVVGRVARDFLTRKERDQKSLNEIGKKYVFAQLVTGNIFDEENRLIAQIPPINEAPELHLRRHSSQNIDYTFFLLERAMAKFTEKYTVSDFSNLLRDSACFSESNQALVDQILKPYWSGDYFTFTHSCVPFVESGIRRLLHLSGASVTKTNKEGGYDYRSLNALLDNEQTRAIFRHIFGEASMDVIYTLQLTLTDNLGQNLRNRVAHGIHQVDFFKRRHADNLLKILFLLSLIQSKK